MEVTIMKAGWIKKSLCFLCLALAAVAMAQSNTSSVLDRVQKVDDPELSELIRVAMESRKGITQKERLEMMRKVTLSYAQIKLLDQQIAEISRKVETTMGPAEIKYELLLAKTELESKLTAELANLREVMGIVPRHAFDKKPLETLNTWLCLNVIDERVYVLDALKPFFEYWAEQRWKSAGLLPEKELPDYIREKLKNKNDLPIRIDIYYKSTTSSAAAELRARIVSLVRETNTQMEAEIHSELATWVGSGESTFFLRQGQIRTFYPAAVQRPDRDPKLLVTGLVNPNDLEQHILWRLTMPKNVPLRFRIEYDSASALLARQVAEMAKAVAKRLGIAEVVEVDEVLVEPVPESVFLGRWQALGKGEILAIDVQPGEVCQVTMGDRSQAIKPGTSVKGIWVPTTKGIVIDINDRISGKSHCSYRGSINAEGNLVINRVEIYPQGSMHFIGATQTIFERVE
jgi:hypothetical protein